MKPRILIVEDASDQVLLIRATLSRDHELRFAHTIEDAKNALAQEIPDLLLLDVGLPDGDGLEFFEKISKDPKFGSLSVIFLTGHGESAEKTRAFNAGAEDYILKPFHPTELQARVTARLRRIRERSG